MHLVEKLARKLRHSIFLKKCEWLWDLLRPVYGTLLSFFFRNGVERNINGTDRIRLVMKYRYMIEVCEPEVWRRLMSEVKPGDTICDIGAFVGIYTIALARRAKPSGSVFSFEPDQNNFNDLTKHVLLNGVSDNVKLFQEAVGLSEGHLSFKAEGSCTSKISVSSQDHSEKVRVVSLDSVFHNARMDIMKIDVEGFEENVLKGGHQLLSDPSRAPRMICMEVHPYAWPEFGASSAALLHLLKDCGYKIVFPDGKRVERIESYGHIFAYKMNTQ